MLDGKVALITGGSSGIGKCISLLFAEKGADVAVVASSDVGKAQAAVDEITAAGGKASAYAADVRQTDSVNDLVAKISERQGPVDILTPAAGLFLPTPIDAEDDGAADRMIDTNLRGTFHCIRAVVPGMKARGGGRIICFSSVAGSFGVGTFSIYCATKAAVSMMVRALAIELAPHNININAIAPGNTATPMNEAMRTDPANAAMLDVMKAATPSERVFSDPADIAELALFLASPASRAMHGATVLIDEGISAGM